MDPLAQKLEAMGVSPGVARELVEEHDPEVILLWMEAVRRSNVDDRAAYLVKALREGWTVSERVQRELFAEQEEQKKEEGRRTAREAENARKEAAARVMEEMAPAERAALESEARATIRQKLPRARETSKAFQSALAEEMRRRALETG
jgi:flagellar biosynthesis GTPase FlhF